ncbi:MAG: signal peptidase II [Bdellovibrionales bacterium]|nr:signal peptidase II [Bdellovibrionales bacterium]
MKNKDWFWILFAFVAPCILDQAFKWATSVIKIEPLSVGFISFFSSFSKLDVLADFVYTTHIVESIVFSAVAVFLIQLLAVLNALFTYKHLRLRVSLSVIMGGLLSLTIDHIIYAETINNVALTPNTNQFYPFNLAVLFICGGLAVFIYPLVMDKDLFKKDNIRRNFLLNNKNQNQFLLSAFVGFTVFYVTVVLIFGLFMHAGISVADAGGALTNRIMNYFYVLVLIVYLLSMVSVFIFSVLLSHRIYGPVYGFENYMRSLFEKKEEKLEHFRTRKKDHFKELEKIAEYIRTRLLRNL